MTESGRNGSLRGLAKNLASKVAIHRKTKKIARRNVLSRLVAHQFPRPVFWPLSQLLTGQPRPFAFTIAIAVAVSLTAGCRREPGPASTTPSSTRVERGGEIAASIRAEPRSFNRYVARDTGTALFAQLTTAKLIRINQVTQELEPWLAESWNASADGLHVTLKLRRDVTFSDGHPFTADDVLFSFDAAYDEKASTVINDAIRVAGKKLTATAVDSHTVEITFPAPFAPGVRLLDGLPMLPKHKLEPALKAGTFASS
jgi:peptide/nickel transport system substrate-binding protein